MSQHKQWQDVRPDLGDKEWPRPPGNHCSPELNVLISRGRAAARKRVQSCCLVTLLAGPVGAGFSTPTPATSSPSKGCWSMQSPGPGGRQWVSSPSLSSPLVTPGASGAWPAPHKATRLASSQAEATWVCLLSFSHVLFKALNS